LGHGDVRGLTVMSEARLNVSVADYTAAGTAGIVNCFHLVIAFATHVLLRSAEP
jgi:hypothetical protein